MGSSVMQFNSQPELEEEWNSLKIYSKTKTNIISSSLIVYALEMSIGSKYRECDKKQFN